MIPRGSRRQGGLATISEWALGALLPLRNKGTSSHLREQVRSILRLSVHATQSSDMNRAESSASGGRPGPTIVSPAASRAASAKFIASNDSSMPGTGFRGSEHVGDWYIERVFKATEARQDVVLLSSPRSTGTCLLGPKALPGATRFKRAGHLDIRSAEIGRGPYGPLLRCAIWR